MTGRRSPAWIGVSVFSAVVMVFLLAPIVVVLIEAFNDSELMSFPPRDFSLRWFQAFFANA